MASRNPTQTGHVIDLISYNTDTLICVCGWKGWAYNRKDSTDGKHWPTHVKESAPITLETKVSRFNKQQPLTIKTNVEKSKVEVAA